MFWNRKERRGTCLVSLQDSSQIPIGPPNSWPLGWSADGKSLYLETEGRHLQRLPARGGTGAPIAELPFEQSQCDLHERLSRLELVCQVEEAVSDVWMIENFDPAQR